MLLTKRKILGLLCATTLATSTEVSATVIDNSGPITEAIGNFGSSLTDPTVSTTYGETITVGSHHVLNNFTLYLNGNNVAMNLRGYVAGWDGSKATNILYTSPTVQVAATLGIQEFFFNTGHLNLVAGQQYVLFLSVADLGPQSDAEFSMPSTGYTYDGGEFVYYYRGRTGDDGLDFNSLITRAWSVDRLAQIPDAAFKATFSNGVPEPTSLGLFGLGLAALGVRRRKQ